MFFFQKRQIKNKISFKYFLSKRKLFILFLTLILEYTLKNHNFV